MGVSRLAAIVEGFLSAQPSGGRYGSMVQKMMQIEQTPGSIVPG